MAIAPEPSWMTDRFNSSNADIKFRSSDGVEFELHRTLLEAHTGAFPGPEIDTQGEVIQLTEPAAVLQVLFDFIYPKRHIDLEDKDFGFVAALAEAVEKYEVFSAMFQCNTRLRSFLPLNAEDILIHAVKHDYPKLISEAVPHLARSSFVSTLERLPPCYMLPWVRYHEAWVAVFKEGRQRINRLTLLTPLSSSKRKTSQPCHNGGRLCGVCHISLSRWLTRLDEIDRVSALHDALQAPDSNVDCCVVEIGTIIDWSSDNPDETSTPQPEAQNYRCKHVKDLSKFFQDRTKAIPPFADFVGGKK